MCLDRYFLSISTVWFVSLYVPERCPLCPCMLIMPCCWSIRFLGVHSNSCGSAPISAKIVNMQQYFSVAELMIFVTLSFVGISGILRSNL